MTVAEVFSDSFFAMGTRCNMVLTQVDQESGKKIFQQVKDQVKYLENQLSRFVPDSPLSDLNKISKNIWISVPDDLWNVLITCCDFYQKSSGAFDITAAPLINLWKKKVKTEFISEKQIEEAKQISGFNKVDFDFKNQKIRFTVDGVEFDLGAIGKGIALDSIKPILQKHSVENGIISFGESSILALGSHPNGKNWPLGIINTYKTDEFVHLFLTSNETITTSGTILNSDEGSIQKRNHIINPVSGLPVEVNKTISVKSESATFGEFISTTWLILSENDKNILSEELKNIEILEVEYFEGNDYKTKLTILN